MIRDANERMRRLLRDLNEISTGEQVEVILERKPLDMAMIVRRCIAEAEPAAAARSVRFEYTPESFPAIAGDSHAV